MIATIGYEGSAIDAFIASLLRASIDLLIDVRDLPLSRKKGFSKNQLAEALRRHGIEYVHLRGLGDPKPGREAARSGQYALFEKIFEDHLKTEIAQRDMCAAEHLVKENQAVLMCYEADARRCHRTIVARQLSRRTGLTVNSMVVQDVKVEIRAA